MFRAIPLIECGFLLQFHLAKVLTILHIGFIHNPQVNVDIGFFNILYGSRFITLTFCGLQALCVIAID